MLIPIQSPEETAARRDRFAQRLAEVLVDEASRLQEEKQLATLRDAIDLLLGGNRP